MTVLPIFMLIVAMSAILPLCDGFQHLPQRLGIKKTHMQSSLVSTSIFSVANAPFEDVIPFLSEHVQPADQMLFVGAGTDMALQLAKAGYGKEKTGFLTVVDSNEENIKELQERAQEDSNLVSMMSENRLKFVVSDLSDMGDVCKQSVFDSIVDYGGLDSVLMGPNGEEGMLKAIDHLQNAVRLGNILVCISTLEKEKFCTPFEERFGWVQELDGDPGEISAWYRGKTNIVATKSNFKDLGLKMYVYTNTDNC